MQTFVVLFWACLVIAEDFPPPNSQSNPLRLWYASPGLLWNDSLAIGNGRLGGMIRGGPATEVISTNEDSFWSGVETNRHNPSAVDSLKKAQSLLLQGSIADATLEANLGLSGTPSSMRVYQPGGDLQIVYQGLGSISNYERWLDLGDGTAGVYFKSASITYKREYFASEPAGVLAIRLTASSPASLSFYVKFQRPSNQQNRFTEASYAENEDSIIATFRAGDVRAVFGARVKIIGGSKRQIGDQIQIVKADEVWIYSDTETTVRHQNPLDQVKRKLAAAISSTYAELREAHVKDYQKLFKRATLSLGRSSDEQKSLSTDARRMALSGGAFDPEFVALYFQFGRYLLISSSRAGTYPANLQGIWNNELSPAWVSGMLKSCSKVYN